MATNRLDDVMAKLATAARTREGANLSPEEVTALVVGYRALAVKLCTQPPTKPKPEPKVLEQRVDTPPRGRVSTPKARQIVVVRKKRRGLPGTLSL